MRGVYFLPTYCLSQSRAKVTQTWHHVLLVGVGDFYRFGRFNFPCEGGVGILLIPNFRAIATGHCDKYRLLFKCSDPGRYIFVI